MPSRDAGPVILAGDVGGTKTALALFERRAPDLTLVREAALPGREFATLESAVARFLSGGPPRPIAAASFGIAVPVVDGRGTTTNLPWTIDEKTLEESIPAGRVRFQTTSRRRGTASPRSLPARSQRSSRASHAPATPRSVAGARVEDRISCNSQDQEAWAMMIVIIGGTGLIGAKTVDRLHRRGHEAIAASPGLGVDTLSGKGLAEPMVGAQVVVDLANSPSFEDEAVLTFFEASGRNLLAASAAAGVKHHVALSVVGTDRLLESGYFRGKLAQENLIKNSGIPYTIVRSTQFFEFLGSIAQAGTVGQTVHVSPALVQPIAADDVADVMADIALAAPANGTLEIAGPERVRLDHLVRRFLSESKDSHEVVTDSEAPYFGLRLDDRSLGPGDNPRIGALASRTGSAALPGDEQSGEEFRR